MNAWDAGMEAHASVMGTGGGHWAPQIPRKPIPSANDITHENQDSNLNSCNPTAWEGALLSVRA